MEFLTGIKHTSPSKRSARATYTKSKTGNYMSDACGSGEQRWKIRAVTHCCNVFKVFLWQVRCNFHKQRRRTLLTPLHFISSSLDLNEKPKKKLTRHYRISREVWVGCKHPHLLNKVLQLLSSLKHTQSRSIGWWHIDYLHKAKENQITISRIQFLLACHVFD